MKLLLPMIAACWYFLAAPGHSQNLAEKQVHLEVRFITLSDSFTEAIGVSMDQAGQLGPRPRFDSLIPVRDKITDLILSPNTSGLTGIVLEGPSGSNPGSGKTADAGAGLQVEVVGVDEDGRIALKISPEVKAEIVRIDLPVEDPGPPASSTDLGKALALPPKIWDADRKPGDFDDLSIGGIEDLIASLREFQELQAKLRNEYSEIIEAAKSDPTEENREAAALSRRSIQTAIFQRAALEREIGLAIELAKHLEEHGQLPDLSSLPKDHSLRTKLEGCMRAMDNLREWEPKRAEADSGQSR